MMHRVVNVHEWWYFGAEFASAVVLRAFCRLDTTLLGDAIVWSLRRIGFKKIGAGQRDMAAWMDVHLEGKVPTTTLALYALASA
jgi:hypothetical protein